MKNQETFWVTNISKMNVSLADLNVTIKALSSVNLLDSKHYSLTKEQLLKSAKEGSLFSKRNKVFVRKVAPEGEKPKTLFNRESAIPSRERSVYAIKEEQYEELHMSDTEFASENADLAEMDAQPLLKKG